MSALRRKALSPARRRLLDLLRAIDYGRIEHLAVVRGEPSFDPPPGIVREVKFGSTSADAMKPRAGVAPLKDLVADFLDELDRLGTGSIEELEIRAGLPFRMRLRGRIDSDAAKLLGDRG